MTPADDPGTVDSVTTIADPSGAVWTLIVTGRDLRPGERGRASWPRFGLLTQPPRVVVSARAWPGQGASGVPFIAWTFVPCITALVSGQPVPLGRVQHLLDVAGFTWSTGRAGHKKGRRVTAWSVWRWYQRWMETDEAPSLKDFATWLGVKSKATARTRLDQIGQTWPPSAPKRPPMTRVN